MGEDKLPTDSGQSDGLQPNQFDKVDESTLRPPPEGTGESVSAQRDQVVSRALSEAHESFQELRDATVTRWEQALQVYRNAYGNTYVICHISEQIDKFKSTWCTNAAIPSQADRTAWDCMMAGEEEQEAAFRLQRALDDFAKNAPQLKATLARIRHIEGQLATSPHRRGAGVTDESLIATLSDGKNRLERWELSCCLQSEEDLLITRGLQDLRTGRLFLRKKWNVSEARNYLKSSIAKFQIAEQSCQDTRRQELYLFTKQRPLRNSMGCRLKRQSH